MSKFLSADRVAGAILLLIGIWYLWTATTLKSAFIGDVLGPSAFPLLLGVLLIILSILLMLKPDENPEWPQAQGWLRIGLILASFIVYSYIIEPLGYIVATSLEMIALSLIFKGPPVKSIIASVVFSTVMFILFFVILDLRLPVGEIFEGMLE